MRFVLFFITATLAIAGQFTTSIGDVYPFQVSAVAADSAGNTYVVGSRLLVDGSLGAFLTSGPAPTVGRSLSASFIQFDAFVTKLDPTGKVLFTDTFAGKGNDMGTAIAVDPSGNIYIAGNTTSDDFPLSKALQTQPSAYGTGFIVKLSNDGSTMLYSTYFGGTLGATSISSLSTDSRGNLYLTGSTTAADFPHTAGMPFGPVSQTGSPQITGAILASISAAGDRILYSGALVGNSPYCPWAHSTVPSYQEPPRASASPSTRRATRTSPATPTPPICRPQKACSHPAASARLSPRSTPPALG